MRKAFLLPVLFITTSIFGQIESDIASACECPERRIEKAFSKAKILSSGFFVVHVRCYGQSHFFLARNDYSTTVQYINRARYIPWYARITSIGPKFFTVKVGGGESLKYTLSTGEWTRLASMLQTGQSLGTGLGGER
ncbi:MAG: hypothetical protein IT284_00500 [Bacteroidetes bacterium]|nr:hypothetical protein [Bacteroidota bacterium]